MPGYIPPSTNAKFTVKQPKGRSFFGGIGHVLTGTSKGIYHGITGLPTGTYMLGRAAGHDIAFGPGSPFAKPGAKSHLLPLAENIGKAEYGSFRHFGKGGDVSGPLFDALAAVTGGSSLAARTSKTLSEVSKASKIQRLAEADKLIKKDTAVMQARGFGGMKGVGYDRAAKIHKIPAGDLKKHAYRNRFGLEEGNMSIGKPAGVQGKYANDPPASVLKNPKHPLFDFYARRYPGKPTKFQAGISTRTRATKAFMEKPQYKRPLLKGPAFKKTRSGFYVPTSPNPLLRAARAGFEQTKREKGGYLSSERQIAQENIRRQILQERINAPKNIRYSPQVSLRNQTALEKAIGLPMAALRMGMWSRPRYYAQNIAQTGQMLANSPVLSAKSARLALELFRHHRDLYNAARAVTGEAQAGALAFGTSPSRLSGYLAKRIPGRVGTQIGQRGIQGAMGYAANIPESHVRLISVLNELQRHNRAKSLSALTPAKVEQYLGNLRRSGVISPEHLPLRRSLEEVGDFGRIYSKNMRGLKQRSMSEKEFMATQIPIFYPMFKALSRYGARFPSEHPVPFAGGLALGKQGKIEQKRLLGSLPFWAQYLVPKSAGDPSAVRSPNQAIFNPSNIYNLQPAADIGRQSVESLRTGGSAPGLSLLQEIGPAVGLGYGVATGHDVQTGYPIKPFSKKFYKQHPGYNKNIINAPINYAQGLPYADLVMLAAGKKPHVRSYEKGSAKDRFFQELFGSAFVPRIAKTKELTKQARRETHYGKGRTLKKKASYYP